MRSVWMTLAIVAMGGCTAVFDAGRHQGGDGQHDGGKDAPDAQVDGGSSHVEVDGGNEHDAGPNCDQDGDGYLALECGGDDCNDENPNVYPDAPPICGNGMTETCPAGRVPASHFGAASAGILPAVQIRAEGTHGTELAVAATREGGAGFGTGVVLMLEEGGAIRMDLPLNRLSDATVVPVLDTNGNDLAEATVNAVSLSNASPTVITAMFTGVNEAWYTVFDFLAGDRTAVRLNRLGLQVPAVVSGFARITRSSNETKDIIEWEISESGVAWAAYEGPAVPLGRQRTNVGGDFVMMQDVETGAMTVWEIRYNVAPTSLGDLGIHGHVAFEYTGSGHWVGWSNGDEVWFSAIDCADGKCQLPGLLPGQEIVVRTGVRSEVPDGVTLSSGARLALILEHHTGRDVLTVQPLGADGRVSHSRVQVLEVDSEYIRDARLAVAETPVGTTVLVAALVAPDSTSEGARVLVGGLRACAED